MTLTDHGDGTASLTGTPLASGETVVTLDATNVFDIGHPVPQTLTIDVEDPPAVTSAASASFGEGNSSSFAVTTTGFPTPALSLTGALPPGLSFVDNGDGTATISGIPTDTVETAYPVTVTASSDAGTAAQDLLLEVGPLPEITSAPIASFSFDVDGSFKVTTTGPPVASLTVTGLPDGLAFTDNGDGTGTISGTPTVGGETPVDVTATTPYGSIEQILNVDVGQAPAFTGTEAGLSCASTDPSTGATFISDNQSSWTLCTTGFPLPSLSLSGTLPPGVTFTDNGDGTATISGSANQGSGANSPYDLTLTMTNAIGTTTQALSLSVQEQVQSLSAPDDPTFVVGVANSYTLEATGDPTPSFSFCDRPGCEMPPSWVQLTDNGNGTATLSGTPPTSAAGTDPVFEVDESNGVGNGLYADMVAITVTSVGFTAASPPSGTVGVPYSYSFVATDPSATFSVAPGTNVPPGLSLSPSGLLSGIPTTVGPTDFSVVATTSSGTATSPPIALSVGATAHTLEISEFRTSGPLGIGDWFAQIVNPTSATVPLAGWYVGVNTPAYTTPIQIPLGNGAIAPGGTVVVAGPYFSLSSLDPVTAIGPDFLATPAGFEVVAPDGTVTDVAGMSGAPSGLVAGTGVSLPTSGTFGVEGAFVRDQSDGSYVNTGDNAADFTYQNLAGTSVSITSSANPATPGSPVLFTATVSTGTAGLTPTGFVQFSQNGNLLPCGNVNLTELRASCTTKFSEPGSVTIVATYSGGSGASGASSTPLHQAVVSGPATVPVPSMSLSASPVEALSGTPVTFSASVSGSVGPPTGSVSFSVGSTSLCTANLSAASASCTATPPPGDNETVTAAYSGDSDYQPATATTSITVSPPAPPAPPGSTTSSGSASDSPTGTATVSIPGESAKGSGFGSLTVAAYSSDPATIPPAGSTGSYYDLKVSTTSAFSSVVLTVCNLNGGNSLEWWDGTSWQVFSAQTYDASSGCATATISGATSPSLAQLSGTEIATVTLSGGYWLAGRDGGVYAIGDAPFEGSAGRLALDSPIVAMARAGGGQGYWLVGADGGVFAYGSAGFYGSMGATPLNQPIVGMAATPDGHGYWLVGADGGVFAFGDAPFYGSMGAKRLNQPIVGMAATPDGQGYWLVGADGGVFAFGSAGFYGSAGSLALSRPIAGMAVTANGQGYWLVGADGGVFAYGDAPFYGSAASAKLSAPIVGIEATTDGQGYWLTAADGGVFAYGDAPFRGSLVGLTLGGRIVGIAASS